MHQCILVLALVMVLSYGGCSQKERCNLVDSMHPCFELPTRNSLYQYPQMLPPEAENGIAPDNVMFAFLLLAGGIDASLDPDCTQSIKSALCLGSNPPCNNNTGLLMPICPDSCLAYTRLVEEGHCNSLFELGRSLQSTPNFQVGTIVVLLDLLFRVNCSNVSSYYFYNNLDSLVDPNQCTDLLASANKSNILSRPNQCVSTPSTVCADTALVQYVQHQPLESRNTSFLLTLLMNLREESAKENCTNIITFLSCYYIFPPCDSFTADVLPLCNDVCIRITHLIKSCLESLLENELVRILREFNCTDVFSYLPEFVHMNNGTQCVDEMLPDSSQHQSSTSAGVIVGVSVAAALVLLVGVGLFLTAVTIIVLHKRVKKQRRLDSWSIKETVNPLRTSDDEAEDLSTTEKEYIITTEDKQLYEQIFSSILIPYASMTVSEEIGHGAFGKVFRGILKSKEMHTENEKEIAIKTIKNLSSKDEVRDFFAESLIMKDFSHPNVLGLSGVCFDTPDGVPYILLPYMANGSLKHYLKKRRIHATNVDALPEDLSVSTLIQMCIDIASGMEYLTGRRFVHRDLAARNCMLHTDLSVKVGDFGLARDIYSSEYYRANRGARIPVKWMAPETLYDSISNEKTDVWSYGVTCWEVFSLGRTPYPGIDNRDILKHITTDGQRLEKPSLCPAKLYNVAMTSCWELTPEERPSFSQLVLELHEYWEDEHAYVV